MRRPARVFVRLREMLLSNADLARRFDALEQRYDAQFRVVLDAILDLMTPPEPGARRVGFQSGAPPPRPSPKGRGGKARKEPG